MSQEIIIKAGQHTRADLVYDEQPGAEVLDNTRLLLQYDPLKLIYLDTDNGSDTNSGYTPVLAKKTYAAAAMAIGGGRDTVQVENDGAVIDDNITVPTQVKQGVNATINQPSRFTSWPVVTIAPPLTSSFATDVTFSVSQNRFVVSASPNKLIYSSDGISWSTATSPFSGTFDNKCVVRSESLGLFFVCNIGNKELASSADGVTWTRITGFVFLAVAGIELPTGGVFFTGVNAAGVASVAYTTDGVTFAEQAFPSLTSFNEKGLAVFDDGSIIATAIPNPAVGTVFFIMRPPDLINYSIVGRPSGDNTYYTSVAIKNGVAFAGGVWPSGTSRIAVSYDKGATWSSSTPTISPPLSFYEALKNIVYFPEEGIFFGIRVGSAPPYKIVLSSDGTTWTETANTYINSPSFSYSSLLRRVIVVGHNGSFSVEHRSTDISLLINANVAGFNLLGATIASGKIIKSCSAHIVTADAATIERSKISYFIHSTGDTQKLIKNEFLKDITVTASPAAQDDVKIISNTIGGKLTIINTAATNRESIKDNIIEGGITATFPVTVLSGNTRGANTNAIFSSACFFTDPQFVDAIDYKLKYKSQGFTADSPLIRKSLTFKNSIGERRNLGAYSAYETNKTFIYDRAFSFLKPSRDGLKIKKNTQANLIVSIDGTPDVATNPDGQWEELLLSYGSLPNQDINDAIKNHIAFIDYLDTLLNTACEIIVDPDYAPATSAIVNGVHAIGAIVLALDPSNILAGDRLQIDTDIYFVLYKSGDSVVLHTPLKTAVVDNQVLPVFASAPGGIYQYVPEAPRQLSRWQSDRTDFLRGASLRFARKWV